MSATLIAKDLTAGHGDRLLFEDLDLVVTPGDVVGLVGVNGAGKSTLLRTLAGLVPREQGTVSLSPPTATVGYLPQEPERRPGETVREFLARRTGVSAAQAALDAATEALTAGAAGADDAYANALERWLDLGGADLDERAAQVAAELGLDVGLDHPMTGLSGGQAARAGLASLLLSRYDVFLLDEPTNDLDLAGLDRLERFVTGLRAGTVVVSHDREFLTRTVNRIVELDLHQRQVNHYGGGYAAYLEEREVARRHAREEYEEFADTKAGLEARARTQRAWMEKGVKNARRKATDNDKVGRKFRAESTEKQAAKAKQTARLIERLEEVEEPRKEWELRMEIAAAPRAGAVVASLRGAVVRRGGFTLGPVDLQIDWADRVAITGANGSGKSTLLAALLGRLPLDEGHAALGPGVVVGEVDQARGLFLGDQPLLDAFGAAVPDLAPADVRTLLAKFGLRADHVLRPAATLSPGERTRAALALLQGRGVNLLVLDEPTNHLDLAAIEQLESALASYPGTLLLVTHDRRMLDAVSVNRRLRVADGRIAEH
ncbi:MULTISPECIES: ABC-F family ATP-binding cassette domain-containing protein [unclassified Micromonospora]|uniref:ABC-F family ATP-binding cassette domain-containing protein n=1 Tax=unclassified Micromonospora TaxID=2617518 RepID=UPI0003EED24C|nr:MULTISPECIES: ABC-F family ATP-binding cassette domain-containing protein [unclassified Micromonospora]EWM67346.1 ABC transporter ATP-binding protein [Micromonospora sp. M42]MCK1809941.1 ATP-binding cassette domain-containing protein [Micromonospora sp. R42106]MCK1835028.1 ATP-binding cassette domain-containing protein [Micromonospora sp. R42003]MCK1846951.1 ATP-binding cassette domain-containing protein [Micromonospora sp. R42004]MCM1020112.1 ATP-binding cassette domain-containing protein 